MSRERPGAGAIGAISIALAILGVLAAPRAPRPGVGVGEVLAGPAPADRDTERAAPERAQPEAARSAAAAAPVPSPARRDDPRWRALQAMPAGELRIEVVDAVSGSPLPEFTYDLRAPGLEPTAGRVREGRLALMSRVGMPANLAVTAPGYARAELRQILLTRAEPSRAVRMRLRPTRALGPR